MTQVFNNYGKAAFFFRPVLSEFQPLSVCATQTNPAVDIAILSFRAGAQRRALSQKHQPRGIAEAAFFDDGHAPSVKQNRFPVAFLPACDTGQAISDQGKRAAAAQQRQTLVAAVPLRQRREFKPALRRADAELRGRLQIMRMRAAAAEDGASGCDVGH
jgi:hypothetical protein